MIVKSAYDTPTNKGFEVKPLQELRARPYLLHAYEPCRTIQLLEQSPEANKIPGFTHPIVFTDISFVEGVVVAVDMRSCTRFNLNSQESSISDHTQYDFNIARASLQTIWLTRDPAYLRDLGTLPGSVFSSWVSETVSRRFGLEPGEQFRLGVLSALWYVSQFTDDQTWDESRELEVVKLVSRFTYGGERDILPVVQAAGKYITTVEDFCSVAGNVVGGARIRELSQGLLYTLMANGWYGTSNRDLCATALVHPPTFLAMVFFSLNDRAFKKTGIGRISERKKPQEVSAFTSSFRSVIRLLDES